MFAQQGLEDISIFIQKTDGFVCVGQGFSGFDQFQIALIQLQINAPQDAEQLIFHRFQNLIFVVEVQVEGRAGDVTFFAKGVNGNVVNAILGIKLHKNIPNMANGFLFVELVSAAHVGMPPFLYVKILYYM